MMENRQLVKLVVAISVAMYVGWAVFLSPDWDSIRDREEAARDWCEDRGGEIYYDNAWGQGGIWCDLGNGTTVQMRDVDLSGYTATATPEVGG